MDRPTMDVDTAGPSTDMMKYEQRRCQESIGALTDWPLQTADRSEVDKIDQDSRFQHKPPVDNRISILIQNQ